MRGIFAFADTFASHDPGASRNQRRRCTATAWKPDMTTQILDGAEPFAMTRLELNEAIERAVAESHKGRWGSFLLVVLILFLCIFLGSLVIREQVRVATSQMTIEINQLRAEVDRLRATQTAAATTGMVSTTVSEAAAVYSPDSPQIQEMLLEWDAESHSHTGRNIERTHDQRQTGNSGNATSHLPNERTTQPITDHPAPASVQIGRPYIPAMDDAWRAVGESSPTSPPVRKSRRGVTVPPKVERSEPKFIKEQSGQGDPELDEPVRAKRTIAQPVSFAPRRRPAAGVIAIGPTQPRRVAFVTDKEIR